MGPPRGAFPSIWHVTPSVGSIQTALDSCASGDTVLVAPGHYHERLVVPNKTVTLGSQTLLTSDTLFISQTILDADSLGTLITVQVGGMNRFVLNGFTLQGGYTDLQDHGGAIHISESADSTDVTLQNLHFTRNYSRFYGGVLYANGGGDPFRGPRRMVLNNIKLSRNYARSATWVFILISTSQYAEINGLECNDATSKIISIFSENSLSVKNVKIDHGTFSGAAVAAGLSGRSPTNQLDVENIQVKNSVFEFGALLNVGSLGDCTVRNVALENNVQDGSRTERNELFLLSTFTSDGTLLVDSLTFRNNRGLVQNSCVGSIRSAASFDHHEDLVQRVLVENCQLGDSSYVPWDESGWPTMLTIEGCSLQHAVFRNNTIILGERSNPPPVGVFAANILYVKNFSSDSVYYHDLVFDNNQVVDLDDNETLLHHVSNFGRCMKINASGYQTFLVDSCVFINNHQPNMAEERPYGSEIHDDDDIGSILYIERPSVISPINNTMEFRNLYFADNDDGGIRSDGSPNLYFHNIRMDRVSRQAFKLSTNRFALDNVSINGCTPFAPIATRSEQMPLWLRCNEPSTVRNCTVINSTTPYVMMAGTTPNGEARVPIVAVENCLFWNNQYDRFEALVPNFDWENPSWNSYRPGRFNDCLLQEPPEYGEDNLIDVPPIFDAVAGPPYLAADSPCIDAGNSDSAFNDLEDPSRPGFALWPSQGSLRNDIGYTGGPLAALLDTTWSALPDWGPTIQPTDFSLGAPFPNPFNPATQIPLTLLHPAHVRLAVHNLIGQEVAVLVDGVMAAGSHTAQFGSKRLASGTYLVTLEADGRQETRTITLLR